MTKLEQYDAAMVQVTMLERESRRLHAESEALEERTLHELGISWVNRDPGFPCWKIVGKERYFNHPRETLEQ